MKYEIYLDVFWVTNFVMDMLVLALVRRCRKSRSSLARILLSSAIGATGSVLLFLNIHDAMIYQILVHFMVNPIMILIGFPVKNLRGLLKDFFMTYLMTLLLGGILSWAMTALDQWEHFWIWALGGVGICMLFLHWMEEQKSEELSYELLLLTGERKLRLTGFLDTGNLLTDPVVKQPVHIIQEDVLREELLKERLAVRYIPFHSLGQEQGLLPVVTLQAMYLRAAEEQGEVLPLYIEKPVFGLAKEKLFQNKKYQVILNAKSISA